MRSVLVALSLGALSACATISVVATETTVETALKQGKSTLRAESEAYCEKAVAAGWIEDPGLAALAGTLMHGRTSDDVAAASYARRIGARDQAPALVLARLFTDSQAARKGLGVVRREAEGVVSASRPGVDTRADLISFERALVRAQMSHRNFTEALDAVAGRADLDLTPVHRELAAFADEISRAQETADALAEVHAASSDDGVS